MHENITKNQHYIPQFYQKSWDAGEKHVYRYNKGENRISKVSIKKNCSGPYLYEADQTSPDNIFEDSYAKLEEKFTSPYRNLIENIMGQSIVNLSFQDKFLIYRLYVNLLTRHPKYIYENGLYKRVAMGWTTKDSEKISPIVAERLVLNGQAYGENFDIHADDINICLHVSDNEDILFSDAVCTLNGCGFLALSPRIYAVISPNDWYGKDRVIYRNCGSWFLYFLYCQNDNVQDVYGKNENYLECLRNMYQKYKKGCISSIIQADSVLQ